MIEQTEAPSFALPTDEERQLLRDSVRGFLHTHWPADKAVAHGSDPGQLQRIWKQLAGQGVTALGSNPAEGGLRELLAVMQELGRSACPVPLADAAVVNLMSTTAGSTDAALGTLVSAVHSGGAMIAAAFAGADPERQAGKVTIGDNSVTGQVNFVDGAAAATHFLVVVDGATHLALVAMDAGGVTATPTRAMGMQGLARVEFRAAKATCIPVTAPQVQDLLAVTRLALCARAVGAAERSFELAVQYAKDRKQFGQLIGRYQALQHKLATNLIALRAVKLSLDNAAAQFDGKAQAWRTFAAATFAYASAVLRQVSLQTHHAFGAIGYAEDHEAPRHFKRVHLDVTAHGGGRQAREELAQRYLGEHASEFPELNLGATANQFRREVRAWLAENWSPAKREAYETSEYAHREFEPRFARALGKTGWLAASWPKQFGGQLPEIASGEVMYGMWYSEPDSGSDLASLRTRADRDGDQWVINGQKIWTTTYWGDYMWLAARTDVNAKPKHAGISMFVVRTDTPGISRTPIKTMYDGEFCNTFFDNVRIPADALVGQLNGGWEVLTGSLGVERAYVSGGIVMKVARQFEELCDYIRTVAVNGKPLREDPVVRDTIGGFAAQIEAGRQLAMDCVAMLARGETPTWEAAITKVFAGELMEQFYEAALDILGMEATLSSGSVGAPLRGHLEQKLRHSLMWVISLGTNEIQRTLIAQRALDLPR